MALLLDACSDSTDIACDGGSRGHLHLDSVGVGELSLALIADDECEAKAVLEEQGDCVEANCARGGYEGGVGAGTWEVGEHLA